MTSVCYSRALTSEANRTCRQNLTRGWKPSRLLAAQYLDPCPLSPDGLFAELM